MGAADFTTQKLQDMKVGLVGEHGAVRHCSHLDFCTCISSLAWLAALCVKAMQEWVHTLPCQHMDLTLLIQIAG